MFGRATRAVIAIEFAFASLLIVYAGLHDVRDVLAGAPPASPVEIRAVCDAADSTLPCEALTTRLGPGRYRIWTTAPARALSVSLTPERPERARALLLRSTGAHAAVAGSTGVDLNGHRAVVPIEPERRIDVTVTTASAIPSAIALDEIGVYPDARGLTTDMRPFFRAIPPSLYHQTLVPRAVAALCAVTVIAVFFLPSLAVRRWAPYALPVLCFSLCVVDLSALFSPYVTQDLRAMYASGPLQEAPGSNLNGGLYQATRLLAGKGLTTREGVVPWERMPGYGLLCGVAAVLFGHDSLVDVAVSVVLMQAIFYSVAVGVFAWAALRLFTPPCVWAVGLAIAWLPKEIGYAQVDAVIGPTALLVLAALCVRLSHERDRDVPLRVDVAVHLAFALWFVMRPDVLPGWFVVAIALHWQHPRRLLLPATLLVAIGVAWGAYKARYTGEFSMTTTSVGASLFCGLWEVPSRFRLGGPCTDAVYFDWIHQHTPFEPRSTAANSFATREVLRFWVTYPGHLLIMLYGKMMQVLNGDLWPGLATQLQVWVFGVVPRYAIVLPLLTVVAVCGAIGYQRRRTLLLGWPLFLNAPLFWVMFASLGRFYSAVGIALLAAAIPPIYEPAFYKAIAARPWRAAAIAACAAVFAVSAWPIYDWLLRNDALHYWTPLLNPAASPLAGLR